MTGETLGKYRITEHLGTGGMAEVYKAYQPGLDRYVAIKVLHSFLASEESFRIRFQREARVVAMLRHPNIIQVYDFDYDAQHNAYYMVMEFIEGPSLKERLRALTEERQLMPLREALEISIAVANALDYAHQRGMVHRDIKPANIMFGSDKQAILSDFGIAKMVNAAALTASGALVGTPAYMAPEQGMGQAGDERSDIYSLATVLYQLVTGQLPFEADTFMGIVLKHINEPPTPPSQLNPALPSSVESTILRAMAKDPNSRFQTAKEFAAELRRTLAALPSAETALDTIALPPLREPHNWETGTLTEAPPPARVTAPAPPAHTERRVGWPLAVLAGAILALVILAVALVGTGAAQRLLAVFVAPTAAAATPLPEGATISADDIATEVAAALATYVATTGVTPTPSPTPTSTPTPLPTPDATATALAACNYELEVVSTEPRQPLVLLPGQRFRARWQIEARGSCAWPPDVHLAYVSGERLRVEEIHRVPPLAPGESTTLEMLLRAPDAYGAYRSAFQVEGGGRRIGPELTLALRVVPPPTRTPTPSPSPTVLDASPTPTLPPSEPLHFSVPVIVACRKLAEGKWWARVGLTAYGGYGDYHYYQNYVSPETEFFNGTFEFEWEKGKAWVGTVIVTSGDLQARWRGSLSMPDDC